MIAIKAKSGTRQKCIPNLLPCRINFDGPVNASERYWKVEDGKDGEKTSYFRGRKLQGSEIMLPAGYQGSILQISKDVLPTTSNQSAQSIDRGDNEEEDEAEEDEHIETFAAEELSTFDRIIIFNHDAPPDNSEDAYVKGIKEWTAFAEAMHSKPLPEPTS